MILTNSNFFKNATNFVIAPEKMEDVPKPLVSFDISDEEKIIKLKNKILKKVINHIFLTDKVNST